MIERLQLPKFARVLAFAVSVFVLTVSQSVFAVDTPDVMPKGIRSLSVKMGMLTGLNEYYTGSGQLSYLSDLNSIELDASTLTTLEPRVQELINILNDFGTFELGNQVHLGKLAVDANPDVTYFAPIFLYGMSKRLTVGIAVPVISYQNQIGVTQRGSNLPELRSDFAGVSPELDDAFAQLDRDMTTEFHRAVNAKGYKPMDNVDEQFFGDVQLIAAYQIPGKRDWMHASQLLVGLPTGPKADADDLTDLENFGRWTTRAAWISARKLNSKSNLLGSIAYQAVWPGKTEKRVPLNREDSLPDASQKMTLTEDGGDSFNASIGASYKVSGAVTTTVAYGYERKFEDQFSGVSGGRASLLEDGTSRAARVAKFEFSYSSVNDFLNKKAMIPGNIVYELSQVLSGENVENQTKHEVWLSVYF